MYATRRLPREDRVMARTAQNVTMIRFANGRDLMVRPSPDEVATAVELNGGGLTRLLDVNGNPAWINPADIVSITSHRRKRRPAAPSNEVDAELAALTDPPSRRR
jgi:hypothetical protein